MRISKFDKELLKILEFYSKKDEIFLNDNSPGFNYARRVIIEESKNSLGMGFDAWSEGLFEMYKTDINKEINK